MTQALYLHIPFCQSKCSYCSFPSYAGMESLQEEYAKALCREVEKRAQERSWASLRTVFLGGGTPTFLRPHLLQEVLATIFSSFSLAGTAEVSIEANPNTVSRELLSLLQECGVNRISFGVQSFEDRELRQIGRTHTASQAREAVALAREAGFENCSLDLMYGLPGQSETTWKRNLESALELGTNHLSLYQLTLEEGTPLQERVLQGKVLLPAEERVEQMELITEQLTGEYGLRQYEISNWALPGNECRHNITYWRNQSYLGLGAGAVSYLQGTRQRNVMDPRDYCRLSREGRSLVLERETLTLEETFRETVIMGLRMNRGVSLGWLEERFHMQLREHYGEILERLLGQGLLELEQDYMRLSRQGRRFANRVMAELV